MLLSAALTGLPAALGAGSTASFAPSRVASVASVMSVESVSASYVVQARSKDPRRTRALYVDPGTQAAQAGDAFSRIATKAQPLWVTDAAGSPSQAKAVVKSYVTKAKNAGRTPLVTVYNIPDRDCGMYSSPDDQITDRYYRSWVAKVAEGLRGSKPIVVLEPDAIAFIGNPACTGRGDRLGLLRYATRQLTKAGAWVYLDAGHSAWVSPKKIAPLLKQAGVGLGRGFSTNVANSRPTTDEKAYAATVIRRLRAKKVTGVKYVVDVSRNGAGRKGPAPGDFCNATAARLGASPRLLFKGALDARLWVKLPGESDGTCNGGPDAGLFFPDGACRLLGRTYYDATAQACRS